MVADPQSQSTRAITIAAPPNQVFPWLAQLGQGRGGFYSYDWLENNPVQRLEIHSADRILPEFQELQVGDEIAVAPGPPFSGFLVAEVEAPSTLVLEMRIDPFTGLALEPDATGGRSLHATWAFTLDPTADGATRLVTRTRARLRLPPGVGPLYRAVLEAIEFVMERGMLRGIERRAVGRPAILNPIDQPVGKRTAGNDRVVIHPDFDAPLPELENPWGARSRHWQTRRAHRDHGDWPASRRVCIGSGWVSTGSCTRYGTSGSS